MDYVPEALSQWGREHVWPPFTQMQGFREETPLIISRGEGVYLYDLQGNRYLDGVSSLWANLHGHRRRELDQALAAQLAQVAHSTLLGIAHPPAILLARRLGEGARHPLIPRNLSAAVVRHPGGPGPLLLPVRPTGRLPGAVSRQAGRAGGGAPPGPGGGDRGAGDARRRGHDCPAPRLSGEGKGGDPAPRGAPH